MCMCMCVCVCVINSIAVKERCLPPISYKIMNAVVIYICVYIYSKYGSPM